MRSSSGSSLLIAFVVAACADYGPTAVSPAVSGTGASIGQASVAESRLTGRCETTFAPPPFPLPPVVQQTDNGTCRLAHLGQTVFYSQLDINFAAGTAVSNHVRFTAANGDVLMATSAGTFAPFGPGVRLDAVFTFTGGTGRFENASGEAHIDGQVDFTTNTTTFEFTDGWLSYTPANRKN
jgi:hypothetical protein